MKIKLSDRQVRIDQVNSLIGVINNIDKSFEKEGIEAKFFINKSKVCYQDEFTKNILNKFPEHKDWEGFSHGNTMRQFIFNCVRFIRKGSSVYKDFQGVNWGLIKNDIRRIKSKMIEIGMQKKGGQCVDCEYKYLANPCMENIPCEYYTRKKKAATKQVEHDIQNEIIEYLISKGWATMRINGVRGRNVSSYNCRVGGKSYSRGFPDILSVKDGKYILWEIKTPTGVLSGVQVEFIEQLRKVGCLIYVVDSLEKVKEVVG